MLIKDFSDVKKFIDNGGSVDLTPPIYKDDVERFASYAQWLYGSTYESLDKGYRKTVDMGEKTCEIPISHLRNMLKIEYDDIINIIKSSKTQRGSRYYNTKDYGTLDVIIHEIHFKLTFNDLAKLVNFLHNIAYDRPPQIGLNV